MLLNDGRYVIACNKCNKSKWGKVDMSKKGFFEFLVEKEYAFKK